MMMKRKASRDEETKQVTQRDTTNDEQSAPADKRPKLSTPLDIRDLGAGYNADETRIAWAIKLYETKLLPFIEENSSIFKHSNFLELRGYASSIPSSSDK